MKLYSMTKIVTAIAFIGVTALPVYAQTDNARLREQNQRIDQGVASGQLTPAEAARLRQRDVNIRIDKNIAHITGGKFTVAERARMEAKLNRTSGAISRDKHNGKVR